MVSWHLTKFQPADIYNGMDESQSAYTETKKNTYYRILFKKNAK